MSPAKTKKEIVYSESESESEFSDIEEEEEDDIEEDEIIEEDEEKEERIVDDDDYTDTDDDEIINEEDEEEDYEEEQEDFEEETIVEEQVEDIPLEEAEEIVESSMNIEDGQTKYVKKRTLKIKYYEVPSSYKKYKMHEVSREQVITMFVDMLGNQKNAETFEKYIFQSVGNSLEKFENKFKYIETARNLIDYFMNLKGKNNLKLSDILDMVKNNKLDFSSNFYEEYREEIKKELKKSQVPVEVVEGLFPCPKCKSENTQHYSVQTRRSDEPPTIFLECLNKFCLHKWRMG